MGRESALRPGRAPNICAFLPLDSPCGSSAVYFPKCPFELSLRADATRKQEMRTRS